LSELDDLADWPERVTREPRWTGAGMPADWGLRNEAWRRATDAAPRRAAWYPYGPARNALRTVLLGALASGLAGREGGFERT
jgi:hypothetical protein